MTSRHLLPMKGQNGLTLIELMIAIALSLIIIAGIFQIFISSKQNYRTQEALGRLQEGSRLAIDMLSRDIRMAGSRGCNRFAPLESVVPTLPETILASGVNGYEDGQTTAVPALLINHPNNPVAADFAAGDALFILGTRGEGAPISVPMADNASAISIRDGALPLEVGDLAMIADCDSAEIFEVTAATLNGGNIELGHAPLAKAYGATAEVMAVSYGAYYVATDDTGRRNLYWREVGNLGGALDIRAEQPLIEGVVDMQVLYGVNDGGLTRYVTADAIPDPERITAVRIDLLFATTEDNLAGEAQSYWFVDDTGAAVRIDPPADSDDRRLYRTLGTTIALRN